MKVSASSAICAYHSSLAESTIIQKSDAFPDFRFFIAVNAPCTRSPSDHEHTETGISFDTGIVLSYIGDHEETQTFNC